jgi:hypothetical protein
MSKFNFVTIVKSAHQLGRRVTALSFIGLILIGNLWLIKKFTGEVASDWSASLFYFFSLMVAIGALLMVPYWVKPSKDSEESGVD